MLINKNLNNNRIMTNIFFNNKIRYLIIKCKKLIFNNRYIKFNRLKKQVNKNKVINKFNSQIK